jgi:hypothetical protein
MTTKIHIERLLLEGLPVTSHHGPQLRAAVAAELQRLIGAHGIAHELRSAGAVPNIRAGTLQLGRATGPRGLGAQIAGAVYGGLGRSK